MSEEEIQKAYKKLKLHEYCWLGFDTPKKTLLAYNMIAQFYNKRMELIKIKGNKCIRYVITHKGLITSLFYIDRNYNDNLEHKNGKIKILDFEIV